MTRELLSMNKTVKLPLTLLCPHLHLAHTVVKCCTESKDTENIIEQSQKLCNVEKTEIKTQQTLDPSSCPKANYLCLSIFWREFQAWCLIQHFPQ